MLIVFRLSFNMPYLYNFGGNSFLSLIFYFKSRCSFFRNNQSVYPSAMHLPHIQQSTTPTTFLFLQPPHIPWNHHPIMSQFLMAPQLNFEHLPSTTTLTTYSNNSRKI